MLSNGHGLTVRLRRTLDLQPVAPQRYIAEEPERVRLVSSLLLISSENKRLPRTIRRICDSPGGQVRLAEPTDHQRPSQHDLQRRKGVEPLLEVRNTF